MDTVLFRWDSGDARALMNRWQSEPLSAAAQRWIWHLKLALIVCSPSSGIPEYPDIPDPPTYRCIHVRAHSITIPGCTRPEHHGSNKMLSIVNYVVLCARQRAADRTSTSLARWLCMIAYYLSQSRLPGGTGVAMAARDESRAVLVGMWTKWSFTEKDEGEPGRQSLISWRFIHETGACVQPVIMTTYRRQRDTSCPFTRTSTLSHIQTHTHTRIQTHTHEHTRYRWLDRDI